MKVLKHKDKIYHINLLFIYDCNFEELCDYLKKYNYDLSQWDYAKTKDALYHEFLYKKKSYSYIWMQTFKIKDIPILSHEVNHFVFHVMRGVDIPLTPETEEAYAYYNQAIMTMLLKKLEI